jgi:predicted RNase H-like HicB family nuclease
VENTFTAVFERDGDWWIGYVEELPGANTKGATIEEARENLREAVRLVLEANREITRREVEGAVRERLAIATE